MPGDDSLVYFQLVMGTQHRGLVQNQSSFLKRVMERTPQSCSFDTQRAQAQGPWKQTKAQLKQQHLPGSKQSLITPRNRELIGCWGGGARTAGADSKRSRAVVWQRSGRTQWEALQQEKTERRNRGKDGAVALLTQGNCSCFLKAKEGSRMYISTDTCLHIEYAGGNPLLGSPNPDLELYLWCKVRNWSLTVMRFYSTTASYCHYPLWGIIFSLLSNSRYLALEPISVKSRNQAWVPFPSTVFWCHSFEMEMNTRTYKKNPFSHQNSGNCVPGLILLEKYFISPFVHCLLKLLVKQECITSWGSNAHTTRKKAQETATVPN